MRKHYPLQETTSATSLTLWLVIIGSAAVGLIACSSDSLWIDEAWMALMASEPHLSGWYQRLWEMSGSTLQMPLYDLYLWLWEKLAGHSEWALRAANIPFFVIGQWALFRSFRRRPMLALFVCLIAAFSPFLWAYLNEARSYTMQYCGACLVVAGLFQLTERQLFADRDVRLFCAGLILLCGTTTLAFPWAGMAIVTMLVLFSKDKTLRLTVRSVWLLVLTSIVLVLILTWDVWSAREGATASAIGKTGWENLFFVGYELLGFSGLGPGRLALRATPSIAIFEPFVLPLVALGCVLAVALFQLRRAERSFWRTVLIYSVLPIIFTTFLAVVAPFRLLPRHFTPVAPVVFIALAYAAVAPAKWWLNRVFILLWLISALTLRTHPRYHRDDYRSAARRANEALDHGERVWWAADKAGAAYYNLPLTEEGTKQKSALLAINRNDFQGLPKADTVILSKPDLYDASGTLRQFLKTNEYEVAQTFPAFTLWHAAPTTFNH